MTDESHDPAPPSVPAGQNPAFTVTAQTISVLVSGQPDIENKFGPGLIRPDDVRLTYRGQHIDARVDGRWVRENGELTTARLDQHYTVRDATDIVAWPDWLCALATLMRPSDAAPSVPADQDAEVKQLREKYRDGLRRADEVNNALMEEVQRYADGKERPVLWSVYNEMHLRAANAEGDLERLRADQAQQAELEGACDPASAGDLPAPAAGP
jgi:hypothetical protein